MNDLLIKNKIKGPINKLFARSSDVKKKEHNCNMAANIPTIKIQREDAGNVLPVKNPTSIKGVSLIEDDEKSVCSDDSGTTVEPSSPKNKTKRSVFKKPDINKKHFNPDDYQNFINNSKFKNKEELSESESDSESESSDGSQSNMDMSVASDDVDISKTNTKKQKQEILIKLLNLEKKGIELSRKFSMESKLSDLKTELEMHTKNAEIDVSVKFQQKALMAIVTGLEMANKKFDPLGAKLDGWGESVMDNLDDYEDIFIKLHEKYAGKADLPPELQLLITLAGSAFMFHITKSMFSSAMPKGLDNIQSSEIMKNISKAMQSKTEISGPSINLSGIINSKKDDESSTGTIETSKEITVNARGKKSLNL